MQVRRFFLLKSLVVLGIVGIFGNIYQQNCIIGLQYEKQRLERQHQYLIKKRDALLVQLMQAKDYTALKKSAEKAYGMTQLPLSRLITFTGTLS